MLYSTTIISRSFTSLLSRLNRIKIQYSSTPHTFLFALSTPSLSSELSSLVDTLMAFSPKSSLGCLSAPLTPGYISCSIALLDPKSAISFRSAIAGQEKTQVGRWHAFRRKDEREEEDLIIPEGAVDWDNIWKTNGKRKRKQIPEELTRLDAERVSSVLYLSDLAPEGLSSAISQSFPGASQLGLLASSTPFITGRPVTLFHNQQIFDTGAVGVAFTIPKQLKFDIPNDIQPLGDPLDVTDSEGNLINTLNFSNPTQLLLSRIRTAGIDTTSSGAITFRNNMEFYLGVLPPTSPNVFVPYQLHAITAGDPSRGTLSLNTQTVAPRSGCRVQFFHRRLVRPWSLETWRNSTSILDGKLTFTTLPSMEYLESVTDGAAEVSPPTAEEIVLENEFVVGSENGVVLGTPGEYPWICTTPGCISQL
ncbi:hypothetical protein J3R30DRAFT_2188415 [Lentinula aciculospora]|uniref:FIST domain-containing protein n=1 Tax=Lentinula aciculospora TaxID=153920 RepID=A0A9W9DRM1_9AGAR|nr:hypothetical protein J3R30DRAFT_2188415 [Lentinula aciculospora]